MTHYSENVRPIGPQLRPVFVSSRETPFRENGQYMPFPVLWSRVVGITVLQRRDACLQLPEVALHAWQNPIKNPHPASGLVYRSVSSARGPNTSSLAQRCTPQAEETSIDHVTTHPPNTLKTKAKVPAARRQFTAAMLS